MPDSATAEARWPLGFVGTSPSASLPSASSARQARGKQGWRRRPRLPPAVVSFPFASELSTAAHRGGYPPGFLQTLILKEMKPAYFVMRAFQDTCRADPFAFLPCICSLQRV